MDAFSFYIVGLVVVVAVNKLLAFEGFFLTEGLLVNYYLL